MSLKLAIPIIAILAAALIWTFAEPYVRHWKGRQAAARRRVTERRRK
ncbi:MAG: hypothetical protein KKC14_17845 [Alphaproteobacteria bacterium]|nr:hypothetical protein [Alphaproteobacteria bacterium]